MDLKEKLVSSFLAFENQMDVEDYVHDIRSEAIKTFENEGTSTLRVISTCIRITLRE